MNSTHEQPTDTVRMTPRLLWFLRILIVVQSLGYAAKLVSPSSLNSFLLASMGDPFVTNLDDSVRIFLWLACLALLVIGLLNPAPASPARRFDFSLLALLGGWSFLLAILSWVVNPGNPFHATDPYGHAARFLAPVALILLLSRKGTAWEGRIEWILRWGVAGTFLGHGLCALWLKPSFIDLIVGTLDLFLGDDPSAYASREAFALLALPVIAIQDFILVALLLLPGRRIRTVALWMAAWGFVTALSRMTAYGWDHWYDLALRACNGGIPLLLYFYWKSSAPKDKPS